MRKTLVHFFTIADYEEEEIWLRKQHKAGWKLVKMTPPCFFTFEECVPEDVIYRLDYKNSEQTEEYMQMLGDFGWEYCGKCLGWLYFRKPASAAVCTRKVFPYGNNFLIFLDSQFLGCYREQYTERGPEASYC